jgi:hypothetical protein
MTPVDERLEKVEQRLAELDALLERIRALAAAHPMGRRLLHLLGLG